METANSEAGGAAFLAQFAQRVATRDVPVPPPPHPYDRAGLVGCILAALPTQVPALDPRRARTLAEVGYALMGAPRLTVNALAAASGSTRVTLHRALPALLAAGLVADGRAGSHHYYFLTRGGEDWLLDVTR